MQYQFHPVANVFPLMFESELAELAADIKENGLREPIWLDPENKIIDGRNRYLACQRAGVEPTFHTYEDGDPITFAVSMNLKRRHLTEGQRGMIAAEVAKLRHGTNRFTKVEGDVSPSTPTLTEAAALVGVSRDTVKNGKTVMLKGTPDEIEAAKNGEIAVATLAKDIRQGVPPERRGKNKPKRRGIHGSRITPPDGKTVEDLCRDGLRLQEAGMFAEAAAKAIGVNTSSYTMMRSIVLLADRTDLSAREHEAAQAALAEMNRTGQAGPAHAMVAPIADRVWGDAKSRRGYKSLDRAQQARMDQFERALGVIMAACQAADGVDVPHLPKERAEEIAAELNEAARSVRGLRQRILEIHQ